MKVLLSDGVGAVPASETVTLTVYSPSSAYVCDLRRSPGVASVKVVSAEPSPHSTLTAHGPSSPGSVNEPRLNDFEVPSLAGLVSRGRHHRRDVRDRDLERLAVRRRRRRASLGDRHLDRVLTVVGVGVRLVRIAPAFASVKVVSAEPSPHSTFTAQGPSSPGSVNEPRLNDFDVPSLAVWSAAAVTTGATFATVTLKVLLSDGVGAVPASETVTLTVYSPSSA